MFKSDDANHNSVIEDLGKDWSNLKVDDMIRGSTLSGVEQRCLDLCSTYIGGSWAAVTGITDLTVKRISGGFTNQLYQVQLNPTVTRVPNAVYPDEPSDVAIKFYQEKHMKNYKKEEAERLNDMIILTIMSQTGLGPKIYGIFGDGFIQGFYPHEQFRAKHQTDPSLVKEILVLCACINHLNVPIAKESNLLLKDLRTMLEFAYANCRVEEIAQQCDLKSLKAKDLREEFDDLMQIVKDLKAPEVFCHNDFRGSNLLVLEKPTKDRKILACDLEYCGYGTRGFDLATIVSEWGKQELTDMNHKMATDDEIKEMLKIYIEECDRIVPGYSKKPENSLEAHFREVKVMILANSMFFLSLMIKQTESIVPSIPFDPVKSMYFADFIYKAYQDYKSLLIKDGLIKSNQK